MRQEMKAVASDLRRASNEQNSHQALREWAINAAEVLEIMGSRPTPQEFTVWAIVYSLAAYGLYALVY